MTQLIVITMAVVTLPPVARRILDLPTRSTWQIGLDGDATGHLIRYSRLRALLNDLNMICLSYVPLLVAVRPRLTEIWSSRLAMTIREPLLISVSRTEAEGRGQANVRPRFIGIAPKSSRGYMLLLVVMMLSLRDPLSGLLRPHPWRAFLRATHTRTFLIPTHPLPPLTPSSPSHRPPLWFS